MDLQTQIQTSLGSVSLERLIKVYEMYTTSAEKKYEQRLEWLKTEEGKQYNRAKAKAYYEKNKEKVRAKNLARYVHKKPKKTEVTVTPVETQPSSE